MGGITSVPGRFLKNWNIENRALRAIDKTNRPAPPRYPTEKRVLAEQARIRSEEESSVPIPGLEPEKNAELDNWLKQVKVYSHDVAMDQAAIEHDPRKATSQRSLPQEREAAPETEFGMRDPDRILPGKVSLRTATELISLFQQDSTTNNAERLAEMYNCRTEDIESLLRHFRVLVLRLPATKKSPPKTISVRNMIFPKIDAGDLPIHEHSLIEEGWYQLRQFRVEEAKRDKEDLDAGDYPLTEGQKRYAAIVEEQDKTDRPRSFRDELIRRKDFRKKKIEEEDKRMEAENKK